MKINTKKSQAAIEFLMTYSWAIIAAVIVVGVILYIIDYESTYKITKEECIEEGKFSFLFNNVRLSESNISKEEFYHVMYLDSEVFSWDIQCDREGIEDCFVYEITETCKQVEVGYFRILINEYVHKYNRSDESKGDNDFERYSNYCWDIGGDQIFTCEENPRDLLCCYNKITKKDITIEWLDENCEREYIVCPSYGWTIITKNGREIEAIANEGDCDFKYKCGDYIVETWEQIK